MLVPNINFAEFCESVKRAFTAEFGEKDYCALVGKIARNYREQFINTRPERDRHEKWKAWLKEAEQGFGESLSDFESFDAEVVHSVAKGTAATWRANAFHYRMHMHADEHALRFADKIDERLFGAPLRTTKEPVFRNVIPEGAPAGIASPQPLLVIPDTGKDATHHFTSRSLDVIGRVEERATLELFAAGGPGFFWMQLAGKGGQGKSRLALELAASLSQDWHAGFIPSLELAAFREKWRYWTPDRPTLIIADDLIADMEHLKYLLQYLSMRKAGFAYPVRLLLVERQRWNDSGLELPRTTSASQMPFEARLGGELADWFDHLAQEERAVVAGARFEPSVIELEPLATDHLVEIVCRWAAILGFAELPPKDSIKSHLERIDESGRPLYAYFLAEALADEQDLALWKIEDLLRETLNRDIKNRWKHHFDGEPPSLEEDHPALRLAVLATITRSADTTTLRGLPDWPKLGPEIRRQALAIVDGPIGDTAPAKTIPGLLPDVLGGWFVLNVVSERGIQADILTDTAWRIAPTEMAAFLQRLSKDFPNHSGLSLLLEADFPDQQSALAAENAASIIVSNLWKARRPLPCSVLVWLQNAAEKGDSTAMIVLAGCYQDGYGVGQEDHSEAVRWYRRGARSGHGISMAYLAACYEEGFGVEQDYSSAVFWYIKCIEAGQVYAMAKLGACFEHGHGIEKDPIQAARWYRYGAEAGDGNAMLHLGFCYENGRGIEKDPIQAARWYRYGAEARSAEAMVRLGACYADGRGVEQDLIEAACWYRYGAEAGNDNAMLLLGFCYENGRGVEQDRSAAVRWFCKSAEAGNGLAMGLMGFCYENGYDVKQDYREAVRWYRQGAEAGNDLAMVCLGLSYANGRGVTQDHLEAVRWYRKSADAGNGTAMVNLALSYEHGHGVQQDLEEAKIWSQRALDAGSVKVGDVLKKS